MFTHDKQAEWLLSPMAKGFHRSRRPYTSRVQALKDSPVEGQRDFVERVGRRCLLTHVPLSHRGIYAPVSTHCFLAFQEMQGPALKGLR